jgi:hypothetical protein
MACDNCTCDQQGSDRIRDLEIVLYRHETRRVTVEERLKEIQKQAARLIEEKYAVEKCPELSNAQKRSDAADALVRTNPEAQALIEERTTLDIELRCTQIDIGFARRQWQREYASALLAAAGQPPRRAGEEIDQITQIDRQLLEIANNYGRALALLEDRIKHLELRMDETNTYASTLNQRLCRLEPTPEEQEAAE